MSTKHIVIVDDLRSPINGQFHVEPGCTVHIARDCQSARDLLETLAGDGPVLAALYLDHDLGIGPDGQLHTIFPLVDLLVDRALQCSPINVGEVIVHTSNPVGRDRIVAALTTARIAGCYNVRVADAAAVGLAVSPV